jgi:hypothetical protein
MAPTSPLTVAMQSITAMDIEHQASTFLTSVIIGHVQWNTKHIPRLRQVNPRPEDPQHTRDIAADLQKSDERLHSPLFILARKNDFIQGEIPADRPQLAPKINGSFKGMEDVDKAIVAAGQHRILANNLYVEKLEADARGIVMDVDEPVPSAIYAQHKPKPRELVDQKCWWPAIIYNIGTFVALIHSPTNLNQTRCSTPQLERSRDRRSAHSPQRSSQSSAHRH